MVLITQSGKSSKIRSFSDYSVDKLLVVPVGHLNDAIYMIIKKLKIKKGKKRLNLL